MLQDCRKSLVCFCVLYCFPVTCRNLAEPNRYQQIPTATNSLERVPIRTTASPAVFELFSCWCKLTIYISRQFRLEPIIAATCCIIFRSSYNAYRPTHHRNSVCSINSTNHMDGQLMKIFITTIICTAITLGTGPLVAYLAFQIDPILTVGAFLLSSPVGIYVGGLFIDFAAELLA